MIKKLLKFTLFGALIVGVTSFFSMGATIHGTEIPPEYFAEGYPSLIGLLDSELFMGIITLITFGVVIYALYLAWMLHELAVHKAQKVMAAHVTLVTALSLAGLFINKAWWVLAIVIAFTNWPALGDSIVKFVKRLKEA